MSLFKIQLLKETCKFSKYEIIFDFYGLFDKAITQGVIRDIINVNVQRKSHLNVHSKLVTSIHLPNSDIFIMNSHNRALPRGSIG